MKVNEDDIEDVRGLTKFGAVTQYAFKHRPTLWIFLLASVLVPAYAAWAGLLSVTDEIEKRWGESPTDLVIQLITLLAVGSVWVYDLVREWKDSLEKYLSVEFCHNGCPRIRCLYAPLVGDADARPMAQSLGQEVNKAERLPIAPMFERIEKAIKKDSRRNLNGGKPFLHYETTIRLTEDIRKLGLKRHEHGKSEKDDGEVPSEIGEAECLRWIWPFGPDDKILQHTSTEK